MHEAVDRIAELRQIAQEIASHYADHPGVWAVLLGGSVARGWADRWSDIELTVCWEAMPSQDVRTDLAAIIGGEGRRAYPVDPDIRTHEEEFTYHREKIDLAHMETAAIAAILDEVTVQCDPSLRKQACVAGLRDAIAFAGDELPQAWQLRAAIYPDELRRTMIERNLVFGPHWWLEMLAERNDLLPLYDILCRIERALMGIVAALNATYLAGDAFKWSARQAAGFPIAPADFAGRLQLVLRAPPVDAVRVAGALIAEIFELIGEHAPEVAIDGALARFSSLRATQVSAPRL